jgi:hypothetical protein
MHSVTVCEYQTCLTFDTLLLVMCEILTAIGFKVTGLWDVTTCNWEDT